MIFLRVGFSRIRAIRDVVIRYRQRDITVALLFFYVSSIEMRVLCVEQFCCAE